LGDAVQGARIESVEVLAPSALRETVIESALHALHTSGKNLGRLSP
jgi:hypothetical protein